MRTNRFAATISAVALLGLLSTTAQARSVMPTGSAISKGRAAAIRAGIADWINAHKIAHVNYDIGSGKTTRTIKPSEVRFRTEVLPRPRLGRGVELRQVDWRLGSAGILRGKAKAQTPTAFGGGKLTRVFDVTTTFMPKRLPPRIGGPGR